MIYEGGNKYPGAFERWKQTPQRGTSFFKMVQVAITERDWRKARENLSYEKSLPSAMAIIIQRELMSIQPLDWHFCSPEFVSPFPIHFSVVFVWIQKYMFEKYMLMPLVSIFSVYFSHVCCCLLCLCFLYTSCLYSLLCMLEMAWSCGTRGQQVCIHLLGQTNKLNNGDFWE